MNNESQIMDRTPIHDTELEQRFLAACSMSVGNIASLVPQMISDPTIFHKPKHRTIYSAILDLVKQGKQPDLVLIDHWLKTNADEYDPMVVVDLATWQSSVTSVANWEHWALLLIQMSMSRRIANLGLDMVRVGHDDTVDVLAELDRLDDGFKQIAENIPGGGERGLIDILTDVTDRVEFLTQRKPGELVGVNTGLTALNDTTGGWQNTDLIVVAGRPGMGKTSFMLKNVIGAARCDIPVAVFSLEMSDVQLVSRMVAMESPTLHLNQIIRHGFKDASGTVRSDYYSEYNETLSSVEKLPVFIYDKPAMSLFEIAGLCRKKKRTDGLGLVVIDYLQLIRTPGKGHNRHEQLGEITRGLKQLAKELNVPVIVLSQLSRDVEKRGGDRRPRLSDLRESGSIEEDADMVGFVYRASYYGIDQDPETGDPTKGTAEFMIEKFRNGEPVRVRTGFDENKVRFHDLDHSPIKPF